MKVGERQLTGRPLAGGRSRPVDQEGADVSTIEDGMPLPKPDAFSMA
jgi:hypothetical protein